MAETIPQLSREAAARYAGKTALKSPEGGTIAFDALDALADTFARALIADGMEAGERVGIWSPNCFEWVAACIGAQRAGGAMVPLYFKYRASEVAEIAERAQVRYLVCTADLASQLNEDKQGTLCKVVIAGEAARPLTGIEISWDDFVAGGEQVSQGDMQAREQAVTGDTISDIMFTSGTTGRPKGGVFTHRSSVAAAFIMQDYNGAGPEDCFCPMGSFAHVGGYKQGWLTGIASGCAIAWGDAFDPRSVVEMIDRLGITIMPAAPITWQGILDFGERDEYEISAFRFAATGGTTIPPELVVRMGKELGGVKVGTGYGMTETCGMDSYTRPEDPTEKVVGTVGRPAPDTEIRIVGEDGQELATGQDGEILIRNPRLLTCYLDDPEATRAALDEDGWFHSGDVGHLDADGYLAITDRLKDMYIINGLNVYPAEIERTLEQAEGVQQVAVIGVPTPVKGEVGAAFIVRARGSDVSKDAVIAWSRKRLASYKVPMHVRFVDDLPRNAMGKVLKNELRDLFDATQVQQKGQT